MAAKSKENPDAHDLAVVLIADISQMTVDAKTHQDKDAGERILVRVRRLEDIIMGRMTPELRERLKLAAEAMGERP